MDQPNQRIQKDAASEEEIQVCKSKGLVEPDQDRSPETRISHRCRCPQRHSDDVVRLQAR
jgi:hypothetical protein